METFDIYTAYSKDVDATTIFKDTITDNGEVKSTKIVGFYYGTPNDEYTIKFQGKLKAIFI